MIQKSKRKKKKSIYKNQTQLVTGTQPSSLHSAALPGSSVKLPPPPCCSHRTARTSLRTPRPQCPTEPEVCPAKHSLLSHEPGASCDTSAARPQHQALASGLLVASQGSPAVPRGALGRGWCHPCTHCRWHVGRRQRWGIYKPIPSSERSIRH